VSSPWGDNLRDSFRLPHWIADFSDGRHSGTPSFPKLFCQLLLAGLPLAILFQIQSKRAFHDASLLERLNQLLNHNQINQPGLEGAEKMRPLRTLIITPSVHLSDVAKQHQKDMPSLIHYFVSSLGRDATSCSDLLSYLLFTPKYTRELSWLS
jgi:hypothetical protein